VWLPDTLEWINEWEPTGMNQDYFGNAGYSEALDSEGYYHLDPGSGPATDPYIVDREQDTQGHACSTAEWSNDSLNNPVDPMTVWAQTCGPY